MTEGGGAGGGLASRSPTRHFEGAITHVLAPIFTPLASSRGLDDVDRVIPNPVERHACAYVASLAKLPRRLRKCEEWHQVALKSNRVTLSQQGQTPWGVGCCWGIPFSPAIRCAELSCMNKSIGVFSIKNSSRLSIRTYGTRFLCRSRHTRPRLHRNPRPRCPRHPQSIRSTPTASNFVLQLALLPTLRLCVCAPRARNGRRTCARAHTRWGPRSGSLRPRRPCAHRRGCLRPPDAGLRRRRG